MINTYEVNFQIAEKRTTSCIKQNHGRMITRYLESMLRHLQRILFEKANGLTFREIRKNFKDETREVFESAQLRLEKLNITALLEAEFLKGKNQPGPSLKIDLKERVKDKSKQEAYNGKRKKELKQMCNSWDSNTLKVIKENIELLEKIQVSERVFMEVKSK